MKILGLTGGIGMGKSQCLSYLIAHGIPAIDTDDLARQLVEPGQPAWLEIRACFGSEIIQSDGSLNRAELARRVFGDARRRKDLEDILHPRIRQCWQAKVVDWKMDATHPFALVVIPLLYETEAAGAFDAVICVASTERTQFRRLIERGWNEEEIHNRVDAQLPISRKMELSRFVIWNEASLELLSEQLDRVLCVLEPTWKNGFCG